MHLIGSEPHFKIKRVRNKFTANKSREGLSYLKRGVNETYRLISDSTNAFQYFEKPQETLRRFRFV